MTIERIDTLGDFERLKPAWNAVYDRDPEAQFFLSSRWLTGVFEAHPGQWLVLVARGGDGNCLGLLPLRLKTVWSNSLRLLRNELQFAGRLFLADYGGILCLPGHEDTVLRALASHLKQMHWSHLDLKNFRVSDRRFALFMEPFADDRLIIDVLPSVANDGDTDALVCPCIDLPETFDAYLEHRLGPNTRQTIRRFLRGLDSTQDYTITTTSAATQGRDVRILEDLWIKRWQAQKGADTQPVAARYGTIVNRGLDDGLVRMQVLWHRARPVFVLASFVDWTKLRLLPFITARDDSFRDTSAGLRNLSVGLVMHVLGIRWAIEHGIKAYDLLRGDEPYKYALGAADVRLKYPLVRTKSNTNLHRVLDAACVDLALRMAGEHAGRHRTEEAATACRQVLDAVPGHEQARQLLDTLGDQVRPSIDLAAASDRHVAPNDIHRRQSQPVTIESVNSIDAFRNLEAAWNAVYDRDPEAQFFLSSRWLTGVFEAHPGQWTVLVARGADGTCLGLLPLRQTTVWSKSRQQLRTELQFAGRLWWADYGGILCLPDHEEAVLLAFASHLKEMNWSHLHLKGFRISDRRFTLFIEALSDQRLVVEARSSIINDGDTDNLVCPYIDLPGTFEAYLSETLHSNTRQKVRRFLRKVETTPDYQVTTTNAATAANDVSILEQLWSRMWAPVKGAKTARLAATYGAVVTRGLSDGTIYMPVLWYRGTPVGVLASFVDRRKSRLLFFVGARDEAFGELPGGLVLHAVSIRWSIEQGIRTYDFLRGNEPYKYSLGAADVRLQYRLIQTRSGTNLNGTLDPACIPQAARVAYDLARRDRRNEAETACRQILAVAPGHNIATKLREALAGES